MATRVTDPALLAQLEGSQEPQRVTDPAILAALNGQTPKESGSALQSIREAIHAPTRILENGFLFGLGDRARAGMDSIIGNGDYGTNLKQQQAETDSFKANHPIAAPALDVVGNVATPLGAIGAAAKGVSLGAKTLYGMGAGGLIGGVQGLLGSRDYTDIPETLKEGAIGAGGGALVGGAIPGAGKVLGKTYNAVADAIWGGVKGVSRGASRHLVDAATADGLPAVRAQLDRLGPDAMLADSGPAFLGKTQGAVLNSDEGRSIGTTALKTRDQGTNARIQSDVNAALGPAEDPQTVTNAIRARRSEVDNRAYPAALDNAPDIKTAHLLTYIDSAIPSSVGMERKALTNLRDMMMTTEKRPRLDAFGHQEVNPRTGQPIFDDVPVSQNNAEVLHKVKQELDNVIQYDQPGLGIPAGALSRQQGTLKSLRGELNATLEQQVPGYAAANRQSAALAKRGEALEAGTQYLGSGKTTPSPDRFAAEFDPLSQGEKIAFAKGSRGNIERVLGTKANDLQALRGELQGEGGWNTAKLATVHGQEAADRLIGSVDRNLKFRDTYNKVVENSQTAQRQAAASAMKPTPASETPLINPNMSLTGLGAAGTKKLATAILNGLRPDPTRSFGELAKVLTAQGAQRDAYVNAIADAITRRTANAATGEKVGSRAALVGALLGNADLQYLIDGRRQAVQRSR